MDMVKNMPDGELDKMSVEEVKIYTINTPTAMVLMDRIMPACYQSQVEAFNGKKAVMTLPDLHEAYDFRIDL